MKQSVFKKISILMTLLILSFCLFACDDGYAGKIDDYDNLLKSLIKTSDGVPDENEPIKIVPTPALEGFSAVCGYDVSYSAGFSGEHAFTVIDSKYYFLLKNGELIEADRVPLEYKYGKYAYEKNGKLGINSIDGTVILDAEYDFIDWNENTIVAKKGDKYSIFENNVSLARNISGELNLISKDYIYTNDGIYDLFFKPVYISGLKAYDYFDGIFFVFDNDSRYCGLVDESGDTVVEIKYDEIVSSSGEYFVVKKDGVNIVLDRTGNEIYSGEKDAAITFDGEYLIYKNNGFFGVKNSGFESIAYGFNAILNNKVYFNDYVINPQSSAPLYSIKNDRFFFEGYSSVLPCDDFFIMKNDFTSKYCIVDKNLQTVKDNITKAQFSGGILMLNIDENYFFYSKN